MLDYNTLYAAAQVPTSRDAGEAVRCVKSMLRTAGYVAEHFAREDRKRARKSGMLRFSAAAAAAIAAAGFVDAEAAAADDDRRARPHVHADGEVELHPVL